MSIKWDNGKKSTSLSIFYLGVCIANSIKVIQFTPSVAEENVNDN